MLHKTIYDHSVIVIIVILSTLTVLVGSSVIGLGLVFPSTPVVLNSIFEIGLLDPEYKQYYNNDGTEASFETNLMIYVK